MPGYNSQLSYDSVESILIKNAKGFSSIEFECDTLRIYPLGEKYAPYTGIVRGNMTDLAGMVTKVSIIETRVLVKRNEGWKLLNGQSAMFP